MQEEDHMPERDFSQPLPAAQVPVLARLRRESGESDNKERITIRLDADVLAWFRARVHGGGNYQSLINAALRAHMQETQTGWEQMLRRVVREELHRAAAN